MLVKKSGVDCIVKIAPKTLVYCNKDYVFRDYSIVWQFLAFLAVMIILRGVYEYQF